MSELNVPLKEEKQCPANILSKLHEKSKTDKRDFVDIQCHDADQPTRY